MAVGHCRHTTGCPNPGTRTSVRVMLGETDLNDRHQIEQLRRSVAMLQQGAAVFDREDSLRLLAELERRVAAAG